MGEEASELICQKPRTLLNPIHVCPHVYTSGTHVCISGNRGLSLQGIIERIAGHLNDLCFGSAFNAIKLF